MAWPAFPVALVVFLILGIGPSWALAFLACAVLAIGVLILWRPGEAPILLLVFLYQWIQAASVPFLSNFRNVRIEDLLYFSGAHSLATFLTLTGILVLALGMRLGAGPPGARRALEGRQMVLTQPQHRWFELYVLAWIGAAAAKYAIVFVPGLAQLLLGIVALKWSAYVLLTYAVFMRPDGNKLWWAAIFAFEFVSSLNGYFSSFKEIFLYTIIGIGPTVVRISVKKAIAPVLLSITLLVFGVVWTSVKSEYRTYVRGDSTSQVVTVNLEQTTSKLFELASNLDGDAMKLGLVNMIERIMYVEYFGVVINSVPAIVPHEHGRIWLDAVIRPVTPRMFFPDKAIIDESAMLNKYTGLGVAGMNEGTQIGIGYMGESYIDFGMIGMMIVILLWGAVLGFVYRWLVEDRKYGGALGMGLAAGVLMSVAYLETSSAKSVGGLFASVLAAWVVSRLVVPVAFPWLLMRPATHSLNAPPAGAT